MMADETNNQEAPQVEAATEPTVAGETQTQTSGDPFALEGFPDLVDRFGSHLDHTVSDVLRCSCFFL